MKTLLLLLLFVIPVSSFSQINIELSNVPFEMTSYNGNTTFAGSILSGLYKEIYGLNLSDNKLNDENFSEPEFLVLADFLSKKKNDKQFLLSLYENDSLRKIAGESIDMNEAHKSYQIFSDFRLISKFVYGNKVRIRYDLIEQDGSTFPWFAMIKKINGRYYLADEIPINDLLIQIGSASPYNMPDIPFISADISGTNMLKFVSEGDSSVVNLTYTGDDFAGIYLNLEKIDSNDNSGDTQLIKDMFSYIRNNDKDSFLSLWLPGEIEKVNVTIESEDADDLMMNFYKEVTSFTPAGIFRSGNERVLFYHCLMSDGTKMFLLFAVTQKDDRLYFESELSNYYAWTLLNTPVIMEQVNDILNKF